MGDRIDDLEKRVEALEADRAALDGCVWLLLNGLSAIDRLRAKASEPSLIEMLEAMILVRQTSDGITSVPLRIQQAESFALGLLAQARPTPEPEPSAASKPPTRG